MSASVPEAPGSPFLALMQPGGYRAPGWCSAPLRSPEGCCPPTPRGEGGAEETPGRGGGGGWRWERLRLWVVKEHG